VSETVTVTGESPVVDVVSTKRELTLDNETIRSLPSVRSYSYLLTTVPGLQTNNNNVNTGPVFAIFPIHGGRGVETRLTADGLKARGATQPTPVFHVYDVNVAAGGPIVKDKLWYYISVREQGQRQNTLNVYYNQNAGDVTKWTYVPDLGRPAFSDRTWENYTPRITWQASRRNKFSFVWDEQPVCRKCSGTTSLTVSPTFIFPTLP